MNVNGSGINASFWIEIGLKIIVGDFPIDNLNGANLDDPMTRFRRYSCCLSIQYDLSHCFIISSTPLFANASARSFSGCPEWPLIQYHLT